jgi:hypothetical protein
LILEEGLKCMDIQGIRVQALLKGMSMIGKRDFEGIYFVGSEVTKDA